ncbi:MAG: HTH-type transcriptional repressor YtrA [Planctomycetes bacterium]|nr:HTH-type transcriptional repressor YtrA [Planctomycetota bacterium]
MRFEIDPRSPRSPGEQLQDQVTFAVASGRLLPGAKLPSVRGLAAQALVNPNTVARAYRELEHAGVVESRPGDGVYVAARGDSRCAALSGKLVRERLGRAVDEALAAGLGEAELQEIVDRAVRRSSKEREVNA